jgi:hypothetical protein
MAHGPAAGIDRQIMRPTKPPAKKVGLVPAPLLRRGARPRIYAAGREHFSRTGDPQAEGVEATVTGSTAARQPPTPTFIDALAQQRLVAD